MAGRRGVDSGPDHAAPDGGAGRVGPADGVPSGSVRKARGRGQPRARGAARGEGEPPRVRDLPAPRRSEGAIGPLFRRVFAWPYRLALAGLHRAGLRPWQLTVLSLAANAVVGWLVLTGRLFLPGLLLIVAGLLDIFDGGLARLRGEASRAGAFLDSVIDRASDLILLGCLFWALSGRGGRLAPALALSSLVASLLVSHVRAEAEALGLTLTKGIVQRLERYVLLMVGFTAPGALVPVLAVITATGAATVGQRAVTAWRQLGAPAPGPGRQSGSPGPGGEGPRPSHPEGEGSRPRPSHPEAEGPGQKE
jgi:CDP-diacylglycerol--glycerol-3-phosphate 3-phosphatidyltransferase